MRSFFDTNVLVYLFDDDAPEKQAVSQALVAREFGAGRGVLSTQVLQEFYVTVTRKLAIPLPAARAEQVVRGLAALPLVRVDGALILAAIARGRVFGFSFWDALIVEAALAGGADRLLTEDLQHGQVIEGLRIERAMNERSAEGSRQGAANESPVRTLAGGCPQHSLPAACRPRRRGRCTALATPTAPSRMTRWPR